MNYSKRSKKLRRNILKITHRAKEAHIGSALSCVDILNVLYSTILDIDPDNPQAEDRDRFVLSKGHAVAALYVTLSEMGFFSSEKLQEYCKNGKKMPGHSTRRCVPGMEVSTGSLGHGLPMSTGMALAAKKENKDYQVFALISDGECEEGATWEAALFANHHKLDNLVAIVDYNKLQAFGRTNEVLNLKPFKDKWKDFGWAVKEAEGHNFKELEKKLSQVPFKKNKPSVLIAHTTKGKGISFLEDELISHYKHFSDEEYQQALKELE